MIHWPQAVPSNGTNANIIIFIVIILTMMMIIISMTIMTNFKMLPPQPSWAWDLTVASRHTKARTACSLLTMRLYLTLVMIIVMVMTWSSYDGRLLGWWWIYQDSLWWWLQWNIFSRASTAPTWTHTMSKPGPPWKRSWTRGSPSPLDCQTSTSEADDDSIDDDGHGGTIGPGAQ